MKISRRTILRGAGALPLAVGNFGFAALAQTTAAVPGATEIPPVLFVHGNGDHAALWMTALWRMESNGVPRDRMSAINFTDPLARADDTKAEPNKSSTEDQRRELGEAVQELKRRTGAPRVALVGNSRGGYSIRGLIRNGGSADVSHAVLCGVPNHGVYAWDAGLNNEFNGKGPFLRGLNEGESEVTPGTAFLTLRSDGMDKYAQEDGRFVGKPGTPTGVTAEGPALKGATNLVLGAVDHRETAYSPRAFREIYKFIAGREPDRIAIAPEAEVRLSGLVTGTPGGIQTNRPVAGASVEIYRVSADSGERIGSAIHTSQTGRRRALGSGQGRSHLVSRDGAHLGRLDHHAFLSFAVSAFLRRRASSCRPPAGTRGRGRRLRRPDVAGSRIFRPSARCRAVRRQGAFGCEAGRSRRFHQHAETFRRGSRPPGSRPVQRGADCRAGLAGIGKPDCDRRIHLLARPRAPADFKTNRRSSDLKPHRRLHDL